MPQHFQAIGFELDDSKALKGLAHKAISNGNAIKSTRPGLSEGLFIWDMGRGLQVFVATSKDPNGDDYQIVSCLPGFITEQQTLLRAYRIQHNQKNSTEIILRGMLENGSQIECVLLNLACNDKLPLKGGQLPVHLTALALQAEFYSAKDQVPKLIIEDESGESQSVQSMFMPLDKDCHFLLSGDITTIKSVVNFHTGEKLLALGVCTSELKLPIIVSESIIKRQPLIGDRFHGMIWLMGQI